MSDILTAKLQEAHTLVVQQRSKDASVIYVRLLESGYSSYQIYLDYGRILYGLDDWDVAAEQLEHALEFKPKDELAMLWLADICLSDYGKGWSRAVELYNAVIEQNPYQYEAYRGIAMLSRTPMVTKAVMMKMLQTAWELDPTNYINNYNLACGYCSIGQYQDALVIYSSLLEKLDCSNEKYQFLNIEIEKTIEKIIRGEETHGPALMDDSPAKRYRWFYEVNAL